MSRGSLLNKAEREIADRALVYLLPNLGGRRCAALRCSQADHMAKKHLGRGIEITGSCTRDERAMTKTLKRLSDTWGLGIYE